MEAKCLTHSEMNAALDRGEAVPLAATMTWLMRYQDAWWVIYEGGWVQVTDELAADDIDLTAARMSAGERTVAGLARAADEGPAQGRSGRSVSGQHRPAGGLGGQQ